MQSLFQEKSYRFILFKTALLSFIITHFLVFAQSSDAIEADSHNSPTSSSERKKVSTEKLSQLAIFMKREAIASVESQNASQLAAEISAVIEAVHVDVGDAVNRGDVLVTLDCRSYQIAQQRAQANEEGAAARLLLAQSQLKNAEKLAKKRFLPAETLLQRQAEFQMAVADKKVAATQQQSADLDTMRCRIVAPFDALVVERMAQEGEYTSIGLPLLKLLDREFVQIIAQIAPKDVKSVEHAREIFLKTRSHQYPLALLRLSQFVNEKSGTYVARLRFTEAMADIGTPGSVEWIDPSLYLSPQFLVSREGVLGVFVLSKGPDGDFAKFVPIPDALEGRPAQINLAADTFIITKGRSKLHDGSLLEVASGSLVDELQ